MNANERKCKNKNYYMFVILNDSEKIKLLFAFICVHLWTKRF